MADPSPAGPIPAGQARRGPAWRPVPEVTVLALAAVAPAFTAGAPAREGDLAVTLWIRR